MKKKIIVGLVLVFVLVTAVSWAHGTQELKEGEKRELVLGQHQSQASMQGVVLDKMAELYNAQSETSYITVFHNSELGSINELLEAVTVGTIDINPNGFGQSSTLYAPMELFTMPYLVKSTEDAAKLMDREKNDVLDEIVGDFEKAVNVHVVIVYSRPNARNLTCNFPVYSPADLNGVKIRSITSKVYTLAVRGLGAIAVPIDWAEAPTALSTGVIEGQENPYSVLSDYQLYDVQKYVMETGHIYDTGLYMVNQDTWDSLSDTDKSLMEKVFKEVNDWETEELVKNNDVYKQNCIDHGMQVINVANGLDADAFKENTQKLLLESYPQYKEYLARINKYLGY